MVYGAPKKMHTVAEHRLFKAISKVRYIEICVTLEKSETEVTYSTARI